VSTGALSQVMGILNLIIAYVSTARVFTQPNNPSAASSDNDDVDLDFSESKTSLH